METTSTPSQIKFKVLIVDDVLENLRVLSATLNGQGYEVRCAKNGSLALNSIQTFLPDLILLDIQMPDMSGYEVCQELKANPKTAHIPVIFLSALDEALDKVKAFTVGGVDYITKPFQIEEVGIRIKHQLALHIAKNEILQFNSQLEERVRERTRQLELTNQELQQQFLQCQRTEELLQVSEERLASILNSLEEVVWSVTTDQSQLLYINPAAEKIYGRATTEFYANPQLWLEVIHPEDRPHVEMQTAQQLDKGESDLEYRILRPDGEVRWVSDRSRVFYDANGKATRIDGLVYDITARKQVEQQLLHDALHDGLTQLPNRAFFMERVEMALNLARNHPNYSFAVLFIDLDRFKIVNDSLGHAAGDELLKAIASQLQDLLPPTDMVARLGGDEFTILLDGINDIKDASSVAKKIQTALEASFQIQGHTVFTGASIGIAMGSNKYQRAAELLRDADIAMYRAKTEGKSRYAVFNEKMYAQTLKLLQIESDLRLAIERREFFLVYQPIVSLIDGKLLGFEALVRWQHPQKGIISPIEFIPIAEETGLITAIGEQIFWQACSQMQQWRQQFPSAQKLKISVNFSSQQLSNPAVLKQIEQVLSQTLLPGNCLQIEITEDTLMDQTEQTIGILHQMKELGIRLSLDDFGKGYSSLSYLRRLPIDRLKVDRSFISAMCSDSESFEIARTIVTLAHTLGMDIVAEGIETAEQCTRLHLLGCDAGQGYLFSLPMEIQSAAALLASSQQWDMKDNNFSLNASLNLLPK